MSGAPVSLNGEDRMRFGMIVSASNYSRSHRLTVTRAGGPMQELLGEIVEHLDALPGRWYIDCISTPDSIYRDAIGKPAKPYYGERQYLGVLGRLDLLREPGAPKRKT